MLTELDRREMQLLWLVHPVVAVVWAKQHVFFEKCVKAANLDHLEANAFFLLYGTADLNLVVCTFDHMVDISRFPGLSTGRTPRLLFHPFVNTVSAEQFVAFAAADWIPYK